MRPKFYISFYKNYKFESLPTFIFRRLAWKDKFNSPRCEREPYFQFEWLRLAIYGYWGDDNYWEQYIWTNIYCEGNYHKAKSTWPWTDMDEVSTWIDY